MRTYMKNSIIFLPNSIKFHLKMLKVLGAHTKWDLDTAVVNISKKVCLELTLIFGTAKIIFKNPRFPKCSWFLETKISRNFCS